jgi:hypothetical protein
VTGGWGGAAEIVAVLVLSIGASLPSRRVVCYDDGRLAPHKEPTTIRVELHHLTGCHLHMFPQQLEQSPDSIAGRFLARLGVRTPRTHGAVPFM